MEIATIIIQRTFRGHVGRKKVRNLKVFIHRICIQNRLETPLGQILFRIERNGAAVIIQNWFRYRISYCKKVLWTKKYRKFIVWRKKFIVLRRAITKSKGYTFHMSEILADKIELRRVASIVICRLVRGFLARKRIHKFISIKLEYLTARRLAAIHIQKQIRKYLIRTKYPSIGIRFVMLLIKNRRWLSYSQNITHGSQILADLSVEASDINIDVIFNRRASFMYRNIRLGDSVFLDILEDCASRIQLSYRKYKTRKAFRLMVQNRNIIRVLRIQHWFIGWTWRRRVKSALSVIQPIWGFKARRLILVRKAILTIQSSWRFYEKRTHIQEVLLMKANRRKRIRMWANELTIVRRERKVTMLQRSRLEMVEAGALLYAATELRWHAYYLLQGARKVKSHTASHELQKLFSALSLNGMLDSGKLLKYLKESKKVLTSDFNASTVELQFSKVKDPTEKRIDYKQFVDLLTNFAILKFLATDKPNIETKKTTSNEEAGRLDNLTDSFAFAGLTGSSALLIKFVLTFLQPTSEYKRATDTLGSKSAELIASNYISDGVRNIQRFVRNKIIIRKLTAHLQELQRQKLQRKKWNSAIKLQNLIRRFLGRRLVVRLAQNVYNKYIDGESDRPYWYNPRTEVAFWTKPKLLGAFDCGMATRMPLAEEEFKILCSLCEKISSTTYCVECKEPFCTPCYSSGHKAGNRASHKHLIMENCVQCEYQIGTRYCKNCGDVFCDSCYKYVHKNGRLRFHVCQRLCERCDNCQDYTAQWKETNSSSQENGKSALLYSQFWCNVCFKRERGCLGSEYESDYLHKVAFYGRSHRDFKLKYEEEMRKKNVAELFLNRTIEIERMKKVRAAIIIQRVVRGYWKRKEIADFVAERKAFMRFRKEEEATRNSISYIILCWIGFPPPLQSDTPLERVMKLYPPYKHHILAAAIENQWGLACRLLIEHEERLKQHPPASVYQKLRAAFREWQSRSRLQNANKNHSDKCRIFTDAELQYRNAKGNKKLSPFIISKLNDLMKIAEKSKNEAKIELEKCESDYKDAENELFNTVGPRGLQRLVNEKLRTGIELPFRINIQRYSRLALSIWESEMSAKDDIESPFDLEEEKNMIGTLSGNKPGKWKDYLSAGDYVIVDGALYKVVPTIFRKKRSDSSKSNSQRDRSRSKSNLGDTDLDNVSKHGSQPGESTKSAWDNVAVVKAEEATEDHIQLERAWMVKDGINKKIFKALPVSFYMNFVRFIGKLFLRSYPIQKVVAIAAIFSHKWGQFCKYLSTLFDEEAPMHSRLKATSQRMELYRDNWLHMSRTPVDMSFDFALRRWMFRVISFIVKWIIWTVMKCKTIVSSIVNSKKDTPYEFWQKSLNKSDIKCLLDTGGDDFQSLGELRMDLEAPCEMMREYISRSFRQALNDTVGDSFLFCMVNHDTGKVVTLSRENEFKTFSKDYTHEETDARTMVTYNAVTIVKDKGRDKELISEFDEPEDTTKS